MTGEKERVRGSLRYGGKSAASGRDDSSEVIHSYTELPKQIALRKIEHLIPASTQYRTNHIETEPKRLLRSDRRRHGEFLPIDDHLDKRGAIVFEYGNSLRAEAKAAGVEDAFRMRSFVDLYIRPLFCEGIGPFRWIAVSAS